MEGIGEDFVPAIADLSSVRHAYSISDEESFAMARELLRVEGIPGGSSTGTLLAAALRFCREQKGRSGWSASSATPAPATCRRSTTTSG
ncbi:hypothetical protein P4054_07845 [Pseudomonas aeruginosa]|nr:hypothetical protein [Pseudomonas aeruginosa]